MDQHLIAKKLKISPSSVHRIIYEDLWLINKKKKKVHVLNERQKEIRVMASKRLLRNHLKKKNMEFVVTIDEAWLYMSNANRKKDFSYVAKGDLMPENWVLEKAERNDPKIMVVGVITGRGIVPLFKVPGSVKINSENYCKLVLKP